MEEEMQITEAQNNAAIIKDIESLRAALKEVVEYTKHLAEEVTEVKTMVIDELINPIKEEYGQMQREQALSDFKCKYAEKLEPFSKKLKAIEGEDFDIFEKAFDDFHSREDGMSEETYVQELANKVQGELDVISKAFGVEPEKIEEVKVETSDGQEKIAEVENGEVKAVEEAKTETVIENKESVEPETEAKPENPEVKVEPSDEELEKALQKELEEEALRERGK